MNINVTSIPNKTKNFNEIEQAIFSFVCGLGVELAKKLLEQIDDEIAKKRDSKMYRYKEKREKSIETLMGTVTYERRYYQIRRGARKGEMIFLLDEMMPIDLVGKVTTERVIDYLGATSKMSYRKSYEELTKSPTYQTSHQTIKNKVSEVGRGLEKAEKERVEEYYSDKLNGTKEVDIIFEEKDGLYLKIQGEKNKKEIKMAKVYEGWEKVTPGSDRYKTIEPMYFAGYEKVEVLDDIVNSAIAQKYDKESIKYKILNGDGASWIRKEAEIDADVIYQLDWFHVFRKASKMIEEKTERQEVYELIRKGEYDKLIEKVKGLYERETDEKQKEKLKQVYDYYKNLRAYLPRYTEREDINLPKGKEYRGMGTMEGSIHNVLEARMKGNGMSWSESGASHMAKILCLKHSDTFEETIKTVAQKDNSKVESNLQEILEKHYKREEKKIRKTIAEALKGSRSKKPSQDGCKHSRIICEDTKYTGLAKAIKVLFQSVSIA